jgi:hypothetical protein
MGWSDPPVQLYDRACSASVAIIMEKHRGVLAAVHGVQRGAYRMEQCLPRQKEGVAEVEQAKQIRSIYWHVPVKATTTQPRTENRTDVDTVQEAAQPTQRRSASDDAVESVIMQKALKSHDVSTTQASENSSSTEGDTTPATQQEPGQQESNPPIDLRIIQTDASTRVIGATEDYPPQLSTHTLNAREDASETQNADLRLDDMSNNDNDNASTPDVEYVDASPPTSIASEPHTPVRRIYRSCRCPTHQHIYDDWPTGDAELTIAKCMTVCMYCGVDYGRTTTLRQHLKSARHAQDNIGVVLETRGRGCSTLRPRALTRH